MLKNKNFQLVGNKSCFKNTFYQVVIQSKKYPIDIDKFYELKLVMKFV